MRTSLIVVLVGAWSLTVTLVQTVSQAPIDKAADKIETPHLSVTTSVGRAASAGARISLFVDVVPKPRMHVYSPEQKDYITIALTLAPDAAFKPHSVVYPKPEKFFFEPLQETQLVYSKPFRIVQDVTMASGTRPLTIKGTLRYQACDDKVCFLPKDLALAWTILN